jgi:intracellular sulfur oxidation DsrE/DsrF family protein
MNAYDRIPGIAAAMGAVLLLSTGTALAGTTQGAAANPHDEYGAIFQLDSGGNHAIKKTLNNIENLLQDPRVKGHVKVELLANSKGFDVYVKNNGFEKQLQHLKGQGVILAQCSNTLRELHISRKDLYPFVTIVPSGVGEITLRQAQGWAYIHPSAPIPQDM